MDQKSTTYTLPAKLYHENDFFKVERDKIFSNEWQWVGRSELVKNPGQFITAAITNIPILIIRDNNNILRGFHNVCRHRASKILLDKEGKCKSLVCPYHGWRYGLNGKLQNSPYFYGAEDFNPDNFSLFPIKVSEEFGLVFVNINVDSESLSSWLGPFTEMVNRVYKSNFVFHNEITFDVNANWKTYVDNYQEGYHIPLIHPQLNKDVVWQEYTLINTDSTSIHSVPPRSGSHEPGSFGWHFPNIIFNAYGRGAVFQRIEPLKPKWCRVVYNLFRPSDVSEEDFESNEGQYQKEVSIEDQKIVPLVQQNLETGIYQAGPLSPKYESGLAYFHQLLMERIGIGE